MSQTRARRFAPPSTSSRSTRQVLLPIRAALANVAPPRPTLAACMPALARLKIVTPVSLRRDPPLTLIASRYPIALR